MLRSKYTPALSMAAPQTAAEQTKTEEEEATAEKKTEFPRPALDQMLPFKPQAFARKQYKHRKKETLH